MDFIVDTDVVSMFCKIEKIGFDGINIYLLS
jgi:hypothetical protein